MGNVWVRLTLSDPEGCVCTYSCSESHGSIWRRLASPGIFFTNDKTFHSTIRDKAPSAKGKHLKWGQEWMRLVDYKSTNTCYLCKRHYYHQPMTHRMLRNWQQVFASHTSAQLDSAWSTADWELCETWSGYRGNSWQQIIPFLTNCHLPPSTTTGVWALMGKPGREKEKKKLRMCSC